MAAATLDPSGTPRLRAVLHQWAFAVSLLAGVSLVLDAGSVRARLAVAVYALSVDRLVRYQRAVAPRRLADARAARCAGSITR